MAKVSGETGVWLNIFEEGPITWMAPTEVLEGGQAPSPPLPRPMLANNDTKKLRKMRTSLVKIWSRQFIGI